MQYIEKGPEPESLLKYKETPGVCFEDLDKTVKKELKESLLQEQGYICCYCGKRIDLDEDTILEHLFCREKHGELALQYDNILASCDGGQRERNGKTRKEKKQYPIHCDAKKGNANIDISPLCPDCENHFKYDEDGNIYCDTEQEINVVKVLGLDCATIRNQRKAAISAYKIIKEFLDKADDTPEFWLKKIIYNSEKDSDGKFPEYCFAARYYISNYCM